ncbi:hypothetical protein M6B38_291565 [Iris pallida]|uniref:Uncharacterized protein n=1 Tax=Iris pallida TaxID=29817 RepID=A0AAX6HU61_IRIPA|nr:hypothetical protein M6B38_291565 [Iris pallida]
MKKNQQYRSRKSWGRVDRGDAHRDRRGCRSSASVTEIWLEWRRGGEGFGVNGGGARTRRPAVVPASVVDVLADAGRVVSSGDSRCGELDADGSGLQATGSNSWQRNLSMCSVSRGPLETRRAGTEFEEVVVGSGLRRLLGGTGCDDPGQWRMAGGRSAAVDG